MDSAVNVGDYLYFTACNTDFIYRLNLINGTIQIMTAVNFTQKMCQKFSDMVFYDSYIWMIPLNEHRFYIYDIKENTVYSLDYPKETEREAFRRVIVKGKFIWLLHKTSYLIFRIDMETRSYDVYDKFPKSLKKINEKNSNNLNFKNFCNDNDKIYMFKSDSNISVELDCKTGQIYEWDSHTVNEFGLVCNEKIYISPIKNGDPIIIYDCTENKEYRFELPKDTWTDINWYSFWYADECNDRIFFLPHEANYIISLDLDTYRLKCIDANNEKYNTIRKRKNYSAYKTIKYKENTLMIPYCGNTIIVLDKNADIVDRIVLDHNQFFKDELSLLIKYLDFYKPTVQIQWQNMK